MDLKREKKFGIKKGEKSGLQKGIKQTQIQIIKSMLKENSDIKKGPDIHRAAALLVE